MTAPLRPADIAADIAADLEALAEALAEGAGLGDLPAGWNGTLALLSDAAAVLDRWPTADEIADLRAIAKRVEWASPSDGAALVRLLDRLDPPQPELQADDVDPLNKQVDRLARFILDADAGYPNRSAGAVDTAMDWIADLRTENARLRAALDARGQQ